jgi:hypothetical protein
MQKKEYVSIEELWKRLFNDMKVDPEEELFISLASLRHAIALSSKVTVVEDN